MNALFSSLKTLFSASALPQANRDEQYLAEAADIYDLERRMRELDSGRYDTYSISAQGIFTR